MSVPLAGAVIVFFVSAWCCARPRRFLYVLGIGALAWWVLLT